MKDEAERQRLVEERAMNIVQTNLRNGKLAKECCVFCKTVETDAHHEDYSKPLEVIWLCKNCHVQLHKIILADRNRICEKLSDYVEHLSSCICSQCRQGRPTADGGYEKLFGYGKNEKWYKRDERPKCSCGLDEILANLHNEGAK